MILKYTDYKEITDRTPYWLGACGEILKAQKSGILRLEYAAFIFIFSDATFYLSLALSSSILAFQIAGP